MDSVELLPHAARSRRHVDVTQSNSMVERVDDGIDHRRRRADGAGPLTPNGLAVVGTLWVAKAKLGISSARGMA